MTTDIVNLWVKASWRKSQWQTEEGGRTGVLRINATKTNPYVAEVKRIRTTVVSFGLVSEKGHKPEEYARGSLRSVMAQC